MVGQRAYVAVAFVLLAGCSDGGGGSGATVNELEQAAQEIDVEATATTGIIRGFVVDAAITPLGNVTVALTSLNRTTSTNDNGGFGFEGLEPGTHFLLASHPGYTAVQQSVEVVAGDQDPKPVRILLTAVPSDDPYVVATQHTVFIQSSTAAAGTSLTVGVQAGPIQNSLFSFTDDAGPNATVAQAELHWEPSLHTASSLQLDFDSYIGDEEVASVRQLGVEPLVARVNATNGDLAADRVHGTMTADRTPPVNVFVNQAIEIYVHVFYNFLPREDWQFGRDGEYPVPR